MSLAASPAPAFTPTATKTPTPENYLSGDDFNFLTPYLPELEVEIQARYGSGDITGLIEALGKESAIDSDNFKWTEEGRLEPLLTGVTRSSNTFTLNDHPLRANQTIFVTDASGTALQQGLITAVTDNTFTVLCGDVAGWDSGLTTGLTIFTTGNEFKKGTAGMAEGLNTDVSYFENISTNIKEVITENGSNLAQKTWLKVNGGYIWYFKNYRDTEKRFKNAIEKKLIEGQLWAAGSAVGGAGYQGTQGLISAVQEGNIFEGPAADLDDFDEIIERMNQQGALSENYIYGTTSMCSSIDRMLQSENVTGVSWGAFDNKEDMALNLEFKGFSYSGYSFYKSRWRYLDDPTGRGALPGAQKVHGVMMPYGSKAIYDRAKNVSATLPMIHVKYRASELTNRKYQMAILGMQAPTATNSVDNRETHFLSERMLNVLGRNNTLIFQGA